MSSTPTMISDLEIRTIGNDALIHNPATGKVHVLNHAAAHVLISCDGKTTLQDIAEKISVKTNADKERVYSDVTTICAEFLTLGLIE